MINLILLAAYAVILGLFKSKDSLIMLLSFFFSVCYAMSGAFDSHPSWANHLIISLIFLPSILLTAKWVSITSICYTLFHWAVSGEYLISETSEYLIGSFHEVAISINLLIMVALIYERYNHDYHKDSMLGDSWIINLCIHHFQISSGKKRGGQC